MLKAQVLGVLRSGYTGSVRCLPVKKRFSMLILLAVLARPIHRLFLKLDPQQIRKYRLEQGLPLSLIWLLFPLTKLALQPDVFIEPEQLRKLDKLVAEKRGVLLIGYHSILMPFLNLSLLDRYTKVVSVGIRKTEFVFGRSFENRIQPEYMFLKKMHTALDRGEIVAVMADTAQEAKQTTVIATRFGPMRISLAVFKIALLKGTPLVFAAPRIRGAQLYFELEILEQPTDLAETLNHYQHFLA
ncbi:MAG: hypothetical protein COA80_02515 [Leeuwenhoekiella sp.]|nr:MAG: hypothetical protein COA80_02515 [Leeuwenhoekiella sp.]